LAVFFFAFCFSAAGTAFAADPSLLFGKINVYTGAYDDPKVEKGQVLIEVFILDSEGKETKDIPYEWGLYRFEDVDDDDDDDEVLIGKGRTASVAAGTQIFRSDLEADEEYGIYIWAKAEDWEDYKGGGGEFQIPAAGATVSGSEGLTETDRPRLDFDDSSGCSVFGLGAGLLALAGLALLGKKSGR
jgi:hypothetical protein